MEWCFGCVFGFILKKVNCGKKGKRREGEGPRERRSAMKLNTHKLFYKLLTPLRLGPFPAAKTWIWGTVCILVTKMESQLPGTLPKILKEIRNGAHALSDKSVVKILVVSQEGRGSSKLTPKFWFQFLQFEVAYWNLLQGQNVNS